MADADMPRPLSSVDKLLLYLLVLVIEEQQRTRCPSSGDESVVSRVPITAYALRNIVVDMTCIGRCAMSRRKVQSTSTCGESMSDDSFDGSDGDSGSIRVSVSDKLDKVDEVRR